MWPCPSVRLRWEYATLCKWANEVFGVHLTRLLWDTVVGKMKETFMLQHLYIHYPTALCAWRKPLHNQQQCWCLRPLRVFLITRLIWNLSLLESHGHSSIALIILCWFRCFGISLHVKMPGPCQYVQYLWLYLNRWQATFLVFPRVFIRGDAQWILVNGLLTFIQAYETSLTSPSVLKHHCLSGLWSFFVDSSKATTSSSESLMNLLW